MAESVAYARAGARIVDVPSLLRAEHDANELAKAFTVSERVAIGVAIEAEIKRQGKRTDLPPQVVVATCAQLSTSGADVVPGKKARDIAAERAGFDSHGDYYRASRVVEYGTPWLVQAMDVGTVAVSAAAEVASLTPSG